VAGAVAVAAAVVVVAVVVEINHSAKVFYRPLREGAVAFCLVTSHRCTQIDTNKYFRTRSAFRFCICAHLWLSVARNVDDAAH
jgi:hypothetical protein